jgi:hypothetical protein
MANFIQSADDKIEIVKDNSYLLNDALRVFTVFTSNGAVSTNKPVLLVNLPNVGKHAELGYFRPANDHSANGGAKVTNTTSSKDGLHKITISLGEDTLLGQQYYIEGWIDLP